MSRMTIRLANLSLVFCALSIAGCPTAPPVLTVSESVFVITNQAPVNSLSIQNEGEGIVTWSVVGGDIPVWLDVTASSLVFGDSGSTWTTPTTTLEGTLGGTIQAARLELNLDVAQITGLDRGSFPEEFTIVSDAGNIVISVTLHIIAEGELVVEPLALDFGTVSELSSFTISNGGTEVLNWAIDSMTPEGEWLDIVPGSPRENALTSGTDTVEVSVDRTGLDPGPYSGEISIVADAGSETVSVLMVVPEPEPLLSVSPADLSVETNEIEERVMAMRNVGTGELTWTIADDLPAWLTVDVLSGTATTEVDRVTLTLDATTLAEGFYPYTITVTAVDLTGLPAGVGQVQVALTVPEPIPVLAVSPTELDLGATTLEAFFRIENAGNGDLDWLLTVNDPWIEVDPAQMTGSARNETDVIDIAVNRTTLNPGPALGSISITSNGGAAEVTVLVEVPPPTLAVVPQLLDFSTNVTERLVAIFNAGSGTVNWSIRTDDFPAWLTLEPAPVANEILGDVSGLDTDGVRVVVDRAGLAPGPYEFTAPGIVVTSDDATNASIRIDILMAVAENPVIHVDTGSNIDGVPYVDLDNVPFIPAGLDNTASFTIGNIGSGILDWRIDDADFPGWLSLDALGPEAVEAADPPFVVRVNIDREGMGFGPNTHTFFIVSNDDDNDRQEVRVEMQVPKVITIRTLPGEAAGLSLETTQTTSEFFVANYGDPDTELNFGISSDKPWLLAFPLAGRSTGVVFPEVNQIFEVINVSIDRSGLDGVGGGTGTFTIFALDQEGNRDDTIAAPKEVQVAVAAAELFFESPAARLRVPSLVREVLLMRNLRFEPIPLPNALLGTFKDNFYLSEDEVPLERTETNQFLTSADNLKSDIVILLDYSGSMLAAAEIAQASHEDLTAQGLVEPDAAFVASADPLQYFFEKCVGSLLDELPEHYDIALMEFHDRNQSGRLVRDFTRNNAAGNALLHAALEGITVTGHGATELTSSILEATSELLAELSPSPSTGPVIPVTPFDDTDLRGIIMISDGRLTTGPVPVAETTVILAAARVRLFGVAWGDQFNAAPMAAIAAETGGHVYITLAKDTGLVDQNSTPFRVPSIETAFDWCNTDLGADPCDLSISQDLASQVVLSYVTLSVEDSVTSRLAAAFDDPNDGNEAIECKLPDQGSIAGELTQGLFVGDVIGDVNLGQVAMDTAGISGGEATVFVYVDYMPRDIVQLDLALDASDAAVAASMTVSRVFPGDGGIFASDWILTGPDGAASLVGPGLYTITTPEPIQYGAFGNLLRLDFVVPAGVTEFTAQLTALTPTTRSKQLRAFTFPDGIPVRTGELFRAPAFPTPEINPTILDFGDTGTFLTFTIRNVGGSYAPGWIFLDWELLGGRLGILDLEVVPSDGRLISTTEEFLVTARLDRSREEVGPIFGMSGFILYESGIAQANGFVPILVQGTILPPVLSVNPAALDFLPVDDSLTFEVSNAGQSTMMWYFTNDPPDWIFVSTPRLVTADSPQEVQVFVNRLGQVSGTTLTHTLEFAAQIVGGQTIGTATVDVSVTIP